MKKEIIKIDSTKGGNGDIWMRLVSFYAAAKILNNVKFKIKVPKFFEQIAIESFSDRIEIITDDSKTNHFIKYTNLGIKDLFFSILKGERFISPYQKAVINDKKKKHFKDIVNNLIFYFLDLFGLVLVPNSEWIKHYQGFLDIVAIKEVKKISYQKYIDQLDLDTLFFHNKFNYNLPISNELVVPDDLYASVLIFPNGTSRQFIPIWWATKYLPDAYYAFYINDRDSLAFKKEGLKVVYFYKEPGDIIFLSKHARWTISTDSFPSHLLQFSNQKSTILLTEVLKSRIISPSYKGKVVDSVAPCHPCLHKARNISPLCEAGFEECLNWNSSIYSSDVLKSINS